MTDVLTTWRDEIAAELQQASDDLEAARREHAAALETAAMRVSAWLR